MIEQMANPDPELVQFMPQITCRMPDIRPCVDYVTENGMQESEHAMYQVTYPVDYRAADVADCPLPGAMYPAEHITVRLSDPDGIRLRQQLALPFPRCAALLVL